MADRPESDDDDESTAPPEVTVPPWLRSGPTPYPSPGSAAASDPAPDHTDEDPTGGRPDPTDEAAPSRITLGARPPAQPAREPEGTETPDDDLSTLPLRASGPGAIDAAPTEQTAPLNGGDRGSGTPDRADVGPSVTDPDRGTRRSRMAWFSVAGVAVLAGSGVLGYFLTRGVMVAPADASSECTAVEESGRVVGDGPGSLDSPAGAVLAFDHAYYVERSAEKAFEAVAPSSRMSEEQVRTEGIEQVAEGTTHCVAVSDLSPTLLDVTLTEFPPDDAPPLEIRQRIRVAEEPDGTWGIVSITPAG